MAGAEQDGVAAILRATRHPTGDDVRRVLDLARAAAAVDGAYPIGEHVVLHLRHDGGAGGHRGGAGGDRGDPGGHGAHSLHLLAEDPTTGALLGYAHLDTRDRAEGPSAEFAVSPGARRRGVGTLLLDELLRRSADEPGRMRLWAHGADAAAGHLAASRGFHRIRHLWQMRRSLHAPLAPVHLPEGIALRTFDPAHDEAGWLALNARAFADLPDQGGWTAADLRQRMAEPWFDPEGFLLAEDPSGTLLGFHWTKVHGHADAPHPLGEVYVVGVDPAAQGRGLGRALTLAGLHHLRARGLSSALLYVDSGNAGAIALYSSLGFAPWDSDTLFRR
jgi:mycothiol synthase